VKSGNINGAVSSNVVCLNSPSDIPRLLTIVSLKYRARDKPWFTFGHGIVLAYIGLGFVTSVVYYLALRAENARRERGIRDEIIDGVNDNGVFICCRAGPRYQLISFCDVGDPEVVERLASLNGRFATVEEAKREKGDRWSGYRYVL